jgi:hypothetical protein
MSVVQNRLLFMTWLKAAYPVVYNEAMRATLAALPTPRGVPTANLGDFSSFVDSFNSLLNNVSDVATTYLTSKQQVQQVQQNVQRINSGLPPLNANGTVMSAADMQAAGYSQATITQVEANLARSGMIHIGGAAIPTWAVFGALGVGAFMLLRRS